MKSRRSVIRGRFGFLSTRISVESVLASTGPSYRDSWSFQARYTENNQTRLRSRIRPVPSEWMKSLEGQVARVFRFVDTLGTELDIINDPQDKLPIPQSNQLISIGQTQMHVESVAFNQSSLSSVYTVFVRAVSN